MKACVFAVIFTADPWGAMNDVVAHANTREAVGRSRRFLSERSLVAVSSGSASSVQRREPNESTSRDSSEGKERERKRACTLKSAVISGEGRRSLEGERGI
ncbi:hypothetical protein Q8A67_019508 [Cirrhinus molitorella]|uniref:Uncharacterized protein n=1 Tax=Cirrhinus molitorella TaxID=172907 RepID=A0AA88PE20_9TELE|nr:hypothetical protein Q8A67_019508 [Cirrhinus molitorella]